MPLLTGGNIANIERIKITTIETTPVTYVFNTATTLNYSPSVSGGTETELRTGNTIYGLISTEDIVKGYDIDFEDQILIPQILALVDGGTATAGTGDSASLYSYAAPVAGSAVSRKAFDLYAYTSDRDTSGEANSYTEWKFPNCKGKPISGSFKNSAFATNKYSLKSRPATGVSPLTFAQTATLPQVT